MRKYLVSLSLAVGLLLNLVACSSASAGNQDIATTPVVSGTPTLTAPIVTNATELIFSDRGTTVDGKPASSDPSSNVYTGASIVYYEAGHDASYGEGTQAQSHTAEEAAAHSVVTITQAGTYRLSGTLSAGQLAIDLGEGAQTNPDAVVTLLFDGVDITCTVAPAVIFYRVYECGSSDVESATPTVDTTSAGANVILADDSENHITGSHVAKIYEEGTNSKLHKYDGAFYSKMSINFYSETEGSGKLYIVADNEGLDSELHLTIHSGVIAIQAQNDAINTNEDGVSVITINGGYLTLSAGLGSEGDGIDSNGYLVMNGGTLTTLANAQAGEGGIDSDSGIYLNGGTILALGGRNDAADSDSSQTYIQLSFAETKKAGSVITLTTGDGTELFHYTAERDFSSLTFSSIDLKTDVTYCVHVDGVLQQYTGHSFGMGGMSGNSGIPPDRNGGSYPPGERQVPSDRTAPTDGASAPSTPPSGTSAPVFSSRPGGGRGDESDGMTLEPSTAFTLTAEIYSFSGITDAAE